MNENAYEKVITGRNLNKIFNIDELVNVENYLVHIESVEGSRNNFIMSMDDDKIEISDIHVTSSNLRDIKLA